MARGSRGRGFDCMGAFITKISQQSTSTETNFGNPKKTHIKKDCDDLLLKIETLTHGLGTCILLRSTD